MVTKTLSDKYLFMVLVFYHFEIFFMHLCTDREYLFSR